MLFSKDNKSIREQLIQMQVIIAVLVILLVTIIGIANSVYHFKEIQRENLIWLADFIADNNSGAFEPEPFISFETLDKTIDRQKMVENVALYSINTVEIYSYSKENNSKYNFKIPIQKLAETNTSGSFVDMWAYTNYFHIYRDAEENDKEAGYVCIRANKSELYSILLRYIALSLLTLCALVALAYYLATQLQKSISEPIQELNEIVGKFGELKFDQKAPLNGSEELAALAKSFNKMASQIKERDEKLVNLNKNLNKEVRLQTFELNKNVKSLEKQKRELFIKNKELEQFAYIASHDLQEPLRTIGSFTQLLERKVKKTDAYDEKGKEYFEFIIVGVKRMQAVIKDVLLFSGIDEESEFISTDLNELLETSMLHIRTAIEEAGAKITVPHPLPTIEIDPKQLPHIFQNIVTNGIKFNKSEVPEIIIGYKEKGDFYEFYMKDNGIGIEPEYLDKIFQMFKRLHSQKEYSGTGIGLAICKKVIDSHEGKIWVESKKGEGSTFFFTIRKNLHYHSLVNANLQQDESEEEEQELYS